MHAQFKLFAVATLATALATSYTASAQTPFGNTIGFEPAGDADAFVPTNPIHPFIAPGHPGAFPGLPLDFDDSRVSWDGLLEEIPSNSPLFGSVIANTGSGLAVVYPGQNDTYQPGYKNGPFSRIGRSTPFPLAGNQWAISVDIFAMPAAPGGELWWTNAASNNDGSGYLTETGFMITPGLGTWNFTTTTGGNPSINLPTGVWYRLEVVYDRSQPNVQAYHNVYDATGTTLLYQHLIPSGSMFLNPLSTSLGGPRYSWFAVWNNTAVDRLYIDNLRAGSPPNSGFTLSLLPTGSCYKINDTVEVRINVAGLPFAAAGGQYFINFDNTKLQFLSAVPGDPGTGVGPPTNPGNPFETEVYECNGQTILGVCTPIPGRLDYAVGVPGGGPGSGSISNNIMAVLRFKAIGEICNAADLVQFRDTVSGPLLPPTRLTDEFGSAMYPNLVNMGAITIDSTAPVINCPSNINLQCPTAPTPANAGTATAFDTCDPTPNIAYSDFSSTLVTPSSLGSWSLFATLPLSNTPGGDGSATLVAGPATPPLGIGSARLFTGTDGEQSAQMRNNAWVGTRIDALTQLQYSTYVTAWNGAQVPYLTIWVDTNGDLTADDRMWFEPDYSGPGYGGPLPAVALNVWQTWNTLLGRWYSDNHAGPGTNAITLAAYLALEPNARIVNAGALGGIRIASGFASPGDVFDANVDAFRIATATSAAEYDFEPFAPACGDYTVTRTWSATDDCGNVSTCVQTINVVDTTDPVITCPPDITLNADAGGCTASASSAFLDSSWEIGDDGGAVIVNDGAPQYLALQLTSTSTTPAYGYVAYTLPVPFNFASLATLSANYKMLAGCFGGGAPRFSVRVDYDNNGIISAGDKSVWVYWGTPPGFTDCPPLGTWLSTGNLATSPDLRFDLSNVGGPFYGSRATADALVGTKLVLRVSMALDGGWLGNQQMLVDDITINGLTQSFNNATAADTCSTPTVTAVRSDALPLSAPYPTGTTIITWTATDACGNDVSCTQNVTVQAFNELKLTVQLQPNIEPAGPLTRCIRLELWNCSGPPTIVDVPVTFNVVVGPLNATASDVSVLVPCGNYTCITARDRLHTLRRTDEGFAIVGNDYVADFTGDPASGGDWLIGGNLNDDQYIDILDFGTFVSQYNVNYGTGNTTCLTPYPHADISGDGLVGPGDFTFIQINFLKFHEANCCGAALGMALNNGPVTRISVRELIRRGMRDLVVADLNRDGWLDTTDAQLFMSGGGTGGRR